MDIVRRFKDSREAGLDGKVYVFYVFVMKKSGENVQVSWAASREVLKGVARVLEEKGELKRVLEGDGQVEAPSSVRNVKGVW